VRFPSFFSRRVALFAALAGLLAFGCRAKAPAGTGRAASAPRGGLDFPPAPDGRQSPVTASPRLIVLGLDGGDWRILDEFIARGRMPNLARLISTGASRTLQSFVPTLSPIVWTTLATGLDPSVHGVLDFREFDPPSGLLVPISGRSREVPAFWNVAGQKGLTVGVVGWWATYPAEEVNGFLLSDRLSSFYGPALAASPATVFPPGAATLVANVAKSVDAALDARSLQGFLDVPAAEMERRLREGRSSDPVVGTRGVLRSTALLGRAGLELYDRARPQVFCLYVNATDEIAHLLAPYTEPALPGTSPEDRQRYGRGMENVYAFVDRLVGTLADRARKDGATLVVLSDHGFKWGQERPSLEKHAATDFRTAAFWHRLDGILLADGPDVVADPSRKPASVFDVAPTFCALLRLSPDKRAKGRMLEDLFRPGTLERQPSSDWSLLPAVRRAQAAPVSAREVDSQVQKLLALGYLSPSQAAPRESPVSGNGRTAGSWNNLGLFWKEQRRLGEAREAFLKARAMIPEEYGPPLNLSEVDRLAGREDEATQMLFEAGQKGYPDFVGLVLLRVREDLASGHGERARKLLESAVENRPSETRFLPVLGRLQLDVRQCAAAEATFQRYLDGHPEDSDSWNAAASAALCRGDREDALARFKKSLALAPDQPRVQDLVRKLGGAGAL